MFINKNNKNSNNKHINNKHNKQHICNKYNKYNKYPQPHNNNGQFRYNKLPTCSKQYKPQNSYKYDKLQTNEYVKLQNDKRQINSKLQDNRNSNSKHLKIINNKHLKIINNPLRDNQPNYFSNEYIPPEIIDAICSFMHKNTLCVLAHTNKEFRETVRIFNGKSISLFEIAESSYKLNHIYLMNVVYEFLLEDMNNRRLEFTVYPLIVVYLRISQRNDILQRLVKNYKIKDIPYFCSITTDYDSRYLKKIIGAIDDIPFIVKKLRKSGPHDPYNPYIDPNIDIDDVIKSAVKYSNFKNVNYFFERRTKSVNFVPYYLFLFPFYSITGATICEYACYYGKLDMFIEYYKQSSPINLLVCLKNAAKKSHLIILKYFLENNLERCRDLLFVYPKFYSDILVEASKNASVGVLKYLTKRGFPWTVDAVSILGIDVYFQFVKKYGKTVCFIPQDSLIN